MIPLRRYPQGVFRAPGQRVRRVDNGGVPENSTPAVRLLAPSQVAEILGVGVDEVIALVMDGRLRGMRVGAPAQWRVDEASISTYLDDQAEEARRIALWHQSQTASFPELWGTGIVRNPD